MESTAQLVDAILHHDIRKNSIFSIRAVYAAAFCRCVVLHLRFSHENCEYSVDPCPWLCIRSFVTGFCDNGPNRYDKMSMFDVARRIDMPSSFIELRHEATHGELPSLQRLQRNVDLALAWLWRYFWAKLDEVADQPNETTRDLGAEEAQKWKGECKDVLRTYVRARIAAKSKRSKGVPKAGGEIDLACLQLVRKCQDGQKMLSMLVEILIHEEKMIVPSQRS